MAKSGRDARVLSGWKSHAGWQARRFATVWAIFPGYDPNLARAEPVAMAMQGRPAVVVMPVEEFERSKALEAKLPASRKGAKV